MTMVTRRGTLAGAPAEQAFRPEPADGCPMVKA